MVYFLLKETWVEWDARVREDFVQQAAEQCAPAFSDRNEGGRAQGPRPPRFLSQILAAPTKSGLENTGQGNGGD